MSSNDVKRELPEEQRKTTEISDDEDVTIQTMERANELARQYEEIKDRTVDENTVLGEITDIDTSVNNSRIIISVDVPGEGSDEPFRFRKPKVWTDEYKFVRWIQHYGYDADSFPNMLKDECEVKVSKDGESNYTLYIPEREKPKETQIREDTTALWNKAVSWYTGSEVTIGELLAVAWVIHTIAAVSGIVTYGMSGRKFGGLSVIVLIVIGLLVLFEECRLKD